MTDRRKFERGHTDEYLMVFDRETGAHLGGLANLSSQGAMLVTLEPVSVATFLHCRVELSQPTLGRHEAIFDAECRWCRKNIRRGWWESGYALSNVSAENEEILSYLILRFIIGEWETPGPIGIKPGPMEDRRKVARYEAKEPLPVRERHTSGHIGGLANLSIDGAMLTTLEPVEKGSTLQCRVELPKKVFQRDYLIFDAECVWCKKNETQGWYESGYRLKNVSELDRVIILYLMIHVLHNLKNEEGVHAAT